MAKVALPLHYPATDQKSTSFILTESIHIIEVEVEVEVDKAKVVSNSISSRTRNNSKPKSNVAQHPATTTTTTTTTLTNTNNANIIPPQISAIASTGLSHRVSLSTQKNQKYHYYHLLTSTNNYALSTIQNHYTPSSPTLESLFMEATSCRSSQPGIETLVSVYNYIRGHKHPNGLFPPYQLGISSDDGVLSVYRSYKGEDLNFCPTSNSSSTLGGNRRGNKGIWWSDIMFVAIPEVNNEEVKTVTNYAFQKKRLDKECDMLVVDRDDKVFGRGGENWTLFDAFLGTASVKAINRMTMDHADELGYIAPAKIYVKYSRFEYPHIGEVLLPNLLVEMRRVKV
ncbi:hypothetical protein TWF706_002902 [Orbilia oligospora]|nr:hypothetical protein TWF706_002902 [Orbilia oligospora]